MCANIKYIVAVMWPGYPGCWRFSASRKPTLFQTPG